MGETERIMNVEGADFATATIYDAISASAEPCALLTAKEPGRFDSDDPAFDCGRLPADAQPVHARLREAHFIGSAVHWATLLVDVAGLMFFVALAGLARSRRSRRHVA